MQLFVISHPETITNEAEVINALFDEGLELFHLRKPNSSENELIGLLKKINTNFYSKIVLHQYYSVASVFGINRIHYSESNRLKAKEEELKNWKAKNFTLSTSIHSMNDYELLPDSFSYTFLGPVFESISKPGYKPKSEEIGLIKNENRGIKIIAIGGITPERLKKVKRANFDGIAMLGAIWNNTSNAISVFRKCQKNANM